MAARFQIPPGTTNRQTELVLKLALTRLKETIVEQKRVLVVGAGGVIGQHMMISQPGGVYAVYTRLHDDIRLYEMMDTTTNDWRILLDEMTPDVVVNLSGESNVDKVEANPYEAYPVNVIGVKRLMDWCDENGKHLIHVSSQAVLDPVNEYGKQKVLAEGIVQKGKNWTIVRPTFVLGIRPFPGIGRENPAERMLGGREVSSVNDRYFSVSFAWDVAEYIWEIAKSDAAEYVKAVLQVGNPEKMSRVAVANGLGVYPSRVNHDSLDLAPRPQDTTYEHSWATTSIPDGMARLEREWGQRELDTAGYKAREIAAFLRRPWKECFDKLETGFSVLHGEVAEDFRKSAPKTNDELVKWYKETEAYIWELTAYHVHPGFNYTGMCKGIIDRLKTAGMKYVLCLGDGTGDMCLAMHRAGMLPVYNDLSWSETAEFAESRFLMRLGDEWNSEIRTEESLAGFTPPIPVSIYNSRGLEYGAIVSADFLEHMPNVEDWVKAIYYNLVPGGLFFAQNAFNCGSGDQGSIPMHLAANDHWEKDWDPLLVAVGFVQESSNWYRKPF